MKNRPSDNPAACGS